MPDDRSRSFAEFFIDLEEEPAARAALGRNAARVRACI
jgi:hypothetical protein